MDYSELVTSIQNGDEATTSRLCQQATPILINYMVIRVGCSREDAEDAVQRMFEYVIPRIREEGIDAPKALLSYMLTSARHMYLKMVKSQKNKQADPLEHEPSSPAGQLWDLIDEERQKLLALCLSMLDKTQAAFIQFFFTNPDADTETVAEHFDISLNNVWTRKHRIVNTLRDCVQKKE
ncbi:MAG: RNA polymerase sigma factor [Balneolaceae bacterium]